MPRNIIGLTEDDFFTSGPVLTMKPTNMSKSYQYGGKSAYKGKKSGEHLIAAFLNLRPSKFKYSFLAVKLTEMGKRSLGVPSTDIF
jgi:hypothetical protein